MHTKLNSKRKKPKGISEGALDKINLDKLDDCLFDTHTNKHTHTHTHTTRKKL